MSDHPERPSEQPSPDRHLIPFTPVPRLKDRSNGWKPEVQRAFIEALADYGSVKAACRAVRRADHGAYALRRHPEGAEFAAAWEAALDHGIRRLEDALMERAINGVEVPVYSYGKLVGARITYNDRLGMFMLRNRAPERFAVGGGARALNAVGKMELDRLKKQWHQEWLEQDQEDGQEIRESLDRQLARMREAHLRNMSPAQRERQIAADAQARADEAAGWSSATAYGPYAELAAELLPHYIAEVEAEWPPLEPGAWEEPEDEALDDKPETTERPTPPPPPEPPQPPNPRPEPRIRTLKDDGWN